MHSEGSIVKNIGRTDLFIEYGAMLQEQEPPIRDAGGSTFKNKYRGLVVGG